MIKNDSEFQVTRERISFFYGILMQMRATTEPGEYPFMSNSYLADIEKLNGEIIDYLKRHPGQVSPAEAA